MSVSEALKGDIAELYVRTNSLKFGQFRLSVHNDNPDLPLSPYYLHYPKEGEPGYELMPELASKIGDAFYGIICEFEKFEKNLRIAGVPKGAVVLGEAVASHFMFPERVLVMFGKVQHDDGRTVFVPPAPDTFKEGDELIIVEDHTSGGRNKKLIREAAINVGFVVNIMLTVVDRMQGGVEAMAELGVELLSIFTTEELLATLVAMGEITQSQKDQVMEYIVNNQL